MGRTLQTKRTKKRKTKKTKQQETSAGSESSTLAAGAIFEADPRKASLDYLQAWQDDKANWKFNKKKQHYLLEHVFDIPKASFEIFLAYAAKLEGHSRETTLQKAKQIIDKPETAEAEAEEEPTVDQDQKKRRIRAKKLVRILSE